MAPAKARKPESSPWSWITTVPPEDIKIEHLLKTYRIVDFKQCIERRRNCKSNPYCCWGLGEKKWVLDGDEEPEEDDYGFREEGEFAGLQNLGATCYVNSLLQLWFHNPILRPAILRWTPTVAICDDNYRPKCAIAQLQAMFARMKVSKRSKIDPTQFVHSLQLDTGEQQDAQEFSKLFMDVIVKLLTEHENSDIMNNVATAFRGELQNETECLGCKNKTSRQQSFSELELGVRKNLNESLDDLLVDEKMTGSEQYFCSVCQKKNDAIRRTQLLKLPPVLNLQLMRFVFDRDTLRKKKVTTSFQFPEILTMTDRIHYNTHQPTLVPLVYHLTAVLVHNGPSASSGHYVAQIKDIRTGDWHKFNDETVDRVAKAKSRKLVLKEDEGSGSGSDSEKKGKTKKSKPNSGNHTSQGAYMLVYILENYVKNPEPDPELWPYLKTLVQTEDMVFEEEFKKTKNDKDYENQFQKQRRLEVAILYPDLQVRDKAENVEGQANDNEDFIVPPKTKIARLETSNGFPLSPTHAGSAKDIEAIEEVKSSAPREAFSELSVAENYENIDFISADWLQQWLDQNNPPPPIENGMLKCEHDKLAPPSPNSNACLYRIVPSDFADIIYSNYNSEGTRFRGLDALCKVCVRRECERLRFLQELEDDHKQFVELSKKFDSKCSPFSKNGQNLPVEILKESCWIGKETSKKWKRIAKSRVDEKSKLNKAINGDHETDNGVSVPYEDDDDLMWPLNSEIKCSHDNLTLDDSGRRLLPLTAFAIIKKYFPDCILTSAENSDTCSSCQNQKVEDTVLAKRNREIAAIQKSKLMDLFNDRNRPDVDKAGEFYIVSQSFIMSWKKFIKDSNRHDPVQLIENQHLICDHNKYMYPLMYLADVFPQCRDISPDEELVSFVHPKEWAFMKDNFEIDHEIKVTVKIPNCKDGISYNPGQCEECAMEWWMHAYEKQFHYENETIYIIRKDKDYPEENSDDDLFIPLLPGPASSKRERKERDPMGWMTKPWGNNGSSNGSSDSVRRSQRPRRTRGEKMYKVSSSLTIKELKVMILRDFKALPSDQHLFINHIELSDPTKTLGELQIIPGEKISLEIDTVSKTEDEEPVAAAETGFQGTLLMGDRS